jgi:hypothetical protein
MASPPRKLEFLSAPLKTIAARYKKAGSFKTKYWTPEVHQAVFVFALPRFIRELVGRARGNGFHPSLTMAVT